MSDRRPDTTTDVFQHLPMAVQIWRLDQADTLRIVAANPASARVLGVGPDAAGSTAEDAFPAVRDTGIPAMCARVARSREPASMGPVRLGDEGGAAAWMTVDASPMDDSHVVVAFNDVRALREAHDQETRRARALYGAILDAVPAVMFVKSAADRRYLHANARWTQLTRLRSEDAIGKTVFELYPAAQAAVFDEGDTATLAAGKVVAHEETVPTATGEIRSIFTTKTPILDEDGTPVLLVGVTQDITDQKKAEEDLRKSREELDETRHNLLETIRELSTPVLPIHDGVLVVPLIGYMDSQRCGQLTEALLAGIQRHRASAVILDVTGVEVVDTAVASHLMQATRAAALLGASCVIVGIAPQVARTLVQIGVDFGEITTRRDLQAGVAYALDQEGAR